MTDCWTKASCNATNRKNLKKWLTARYKGRVMNLDTVSFRQLHVSFFGGGEGGDFSFDLFTF